MKRTKKPSSSPKNKVVSKVSKSRVDPNAEQMKAALRASVPYETPFLIPAELAPAELRTYVEEALERAKKTVEVAALNLANLLTQPLSTLEIARVRDLTKQLTETVLSTLENHARQLVVDALLSKGQKVPVEGAIPGREPLQVEEAGYVVRMRPYRNTFDAKKYEPMMRAKGLDPREGAQQIVTYKPDSKKINGLVERGLLTAEERESIRYKLTWTVERPRTLDEMQKALSAGEGEEGGE